MKITQIEVIPVAIPWVERVREPMARVNPRRTSQDVYVFKVHTDEGLVGIAEGDYPVPNLERYIGHSPFDFVLDDEAEWLIMAFYDLMGKAMGLPAYKLLGPRFWDRVPTAYWSQCYPPQDMAVEAEWALKQGFTLHKIKVRPFLQDPVAQVAAMAEVTPESYSILPDANETFGTPSRALSIAREFEKFPQVRALEEPIPRLNLEGYRYLRSKLDYPLAIHAAPYSPSFREAKILETVAQEVSVCNAFVLETSRMGRSMYGVAALAEAYGVTLWIENGHKSGISTMWQAHQAASMPNLELCITLIFQQEDDLVVEPLEVKDGCMEVPQRPGLGVTLDEEGLDRYRTG